jgi:hypothetical protein
MEKVLTNECCPKFDPAPWNEKEITLDNRLFLKDRVTSFFHIPLNFSSVMKRSMKKIENENALAKDFLLLSDENSLWGADIYIATDKEVSNSEMQRISGKFLTKVFEGPYQNVRNWIKEMNEYVGNKNKNLKKLYFYYTTCPKCAKTCGKNYVVLFAEV